MCKVCKVVPEDKQILFNTEALSAEVPPGPFAQATRAARPLLRVAVQLRELHQLVVLEGVVVTCLFPHTRRVDHQRLLCEREELSLNERNKCFKIDM